MLLWTLEMASFQGVWRLSISSAAATAGRKRDVTLGTKPIPLISKLRMTPCTFSLSRFRNEIVSLSPSLSNQLPCHNVFTFTVSGVCGTIGRLRND